MLKRLGRIKTKRVYNLLNRDKEMMKQKTPLGRGESKFENIESKIKY